MLTIVLPWPKAALWPNRSNGRHWAVRGVLAQEARHEAATLTREVLNTSRLKPEGNMQVTYTFHCATSRRYDMEGAYSAMKAAQDGIADALGVDDFTFEPVVLRRGQPMKQPCVVVEIEGRWVYV